MGRSHQKFPENDALRQSVTVCARCSARMLETLSMAGTFTTYANYRPIISTKAHLLHLAARTDAHVTVAYDTQRRIVGFAVLQYPSPKERWRRVGEKIMMEVSVIEVCRPWRSRGISTEMLVSLVSEPQNADRILYMVGYSWTWDLEGTGLSPIAYRNMMIRLFSRQGFQTFQTNEPNIMMRPENLFMARIGENISPSIIKKFKWVRFGMDI